MFILYQIITNNADGSNGLKYTTCKNVVEAMRDLAYQGCETYASADGLQVSEFKFVCRDSLEYFLSDNEIDLIYSEDELDD